MNKTAHVKGKLVRLSGETTKGKKTGETYVAVQVAKMAIVPFGKKAKIVGWGSAQWVREELITA